MRITRDVVLDALLLPSRPALSEKALLRVLGGRREELGPLRLLLQRLVREGLLEHRSGRFRASPKALASAPARRASASERSELPRKRDAPSASTAGDARPTREGRAEHAPRDAGTAGPAHLARPGRAPREARPAREPRTPRAARAARESRAPREPRGRAHGERGVREEETPRRAPRDERDGPRGETPPAAKTKRPPRERSGTTRWVGIVAPGAGKGRDARIVPYRDDTPWSLAVVAGDLGGARPGDVVVAASVGPAPSPRRGGARGALRPLTRARVSEVLGVPGDPEADFQAIVWRHGLRVAFPPEVMAEAAALPEAPTASELARRLDLRERPFLTIDPATARDHDDAVCVEALPHGGTKLWVAIADVSHFVTPGSALDAEALRRANSVYFPDRAIPMLPHVLSGDVCSLRAGVDRLVLVAELDYDADAVLRRRDFHAGVIRSTAGLAYEPAAEVMEGRSGGIDDPRLRAQLEGLADLARRLLARRKAAGALDLELPAAEIVLGPDGRPADVVPARRTIAHRAIEEAMLAANRAVAEVLEASGAPAVYRIHEAPDPAKLEALGALFERFGLLRRAGVAAPDPREITDALRRAAGQPEERLVNLVALRSMKQARYHEANLGHFALAFESYLHFTSPIRRYADLVVHRALRERIDGAPSDVSSARALGLARVAEHLSGQERVAVEAERDMTDLKRCLFLQDKTGEEHDGTVTGVAPHGFYVTLDRWLVDGLVHVSRLPRNVALDDAGFALVAPRGGGRWQLGDRVRVRLDSVDVRKGWVSLVLVEGEGEGGARRRRPARAPKPDSKPDWKRDSSWDAKVSPARDAKRGSTRDAKRGPGGRPKGRPAR